jgi:amidase
MRTFLMLTAAVCGLAALYQGVSGPAQAQPVPPPAAQQQVAEHNRLVGVDLTDLAQQLADGSITSERLVTLYHQRIAERDDGDYGINAVVALYADALPLARTLDAERAAGRLRGPLHGIPILLKDNIEALGEHPTTAGSLALARNVTGRDSPLVARLRAAGAIILGRTNLSEWANFRDGDSTSGWSAMWGLTRNPNLLDRTACGSSSGSGAAIAASLAAAAIGTETDGSIVCPAGTNGIVGFKPTLGLISRRHIIPISASQDTAGPMTASVRDAALLMSVMAATDAEDPATAEADRRRTDYVAALHPDALRGMRIGVLRDQLGGDPRIATMVDQSVAVMRERGAIIVDIRNDGIDRQAIGTAEFTVLLTEFREDLNAYLASVPVAGMPRTLAELIAFNRTEPRELYWFGQGLFEQAEATGAGGGRNSATYRTALATARRLAGPQGIDRLRREHRVDILLGVTNGPAWNIDLINGDRFVGPSASQLPAVAGYPHLTVPMDRIHGLPIGLSFIGTRWDDARVLAAGHAFELATPFRIGGTPGYRQRVDLSR